MIAIVGATGYIGRYLCLYLKQKGYDILALGRSGIARAFLENHGVSFEYFDINEDACFQTLEKYPIETMLNLAACLAEHETPVEKFFEVNTIGVCRLLEYCKCHSIQKFILTSSHKVYNDVDKEIIDEQTPVAFRGEHSPYIISKIAAEEFVKYYTKDYGISGIILRLSGVHGYGEILGHLAKDGTYQKSTFEIFFERALKGEPIEVWGNQSIVRDHVYIKDVLHAIECAINAPLNKAGIYNIASGVGYSQYEEACAIAKVFMQNGNVSQVSLYPERAGLTRGYVYSIEKARKEIAYNPSYTDIYAMLEDYKKEWETKECHNNHHIKSEDAPLTL